MCLPKKKSRKSLYLELWMGMKSEVVDFQIEEAVYNEKLHASQLALLQVVKWDNYPGNKPLPLPGTIHQQCLCLWTQSKVRQKYGSNVPWLDLRNYQSY